MKTIAITKMQQIKTTRVALVISAHYCGGIVPASPHRLPWAVNPRTEATPRCSFAAPKAGVPSMSAMITPDDAHRSRRLFRARIAG
jgi:hypothetical protein